MANWTNLKAAIAETITTNGNQEITGAALQNTLNTIVNAVGANATFAGVATPTMNPGVPDGPVFYLAGADGVYSNFEVTLQNEIAALLYTSDGTWAKLTISKETYSSTELRNIINGTSTTVNSHSDPFKFLGAFDSYSALQDKLNTLTYKINEFGNNYGYFRANVLNHRQVEIKNMLISSTLDHIVQVVSGCLKITDGILNLDENTYRVFTRVHKDSTWGDWSSACEGLTVDDKIKINSGFVGTTTQSQPIELNSYTEEGVYNFLNATFTDGSPILNNGVVSGRLTVLVTQEESSKVVTQVLNLNNNQGGEGNIYIRSNQNGTWKPWGKLQTNIEVGQITPDDMSNLTDNGIYSGVCVDGTTVETFVLIVINNYLAATQAGFGSYISQLKYAIDLNRGNTVKTRTRDAYGIWDEWSEIGGSTYELPQATSNTLGGVKLGTPQYESATIGSSGLVGVTVDSSGRLCFKVATGLSTKSGLLCLKEASNKEFGGVILGTVNEDLSVIPCCLGTITNLGSAWNLSAIGVPYNQEQFCFKSNGLNLVEGIGSATKITWDANSNMDDYTTAGVYDIEGTRGSLYDSLPIANIGENATIAARLIVTVTPEGATTYRHSIGQTLILSNAEGKETKVYTRNGNRTIPTGASYYTITWSNWKCLQGMVEYGIVTDEYSWGITESPTGNAPGFGMHDLIENGMYSGVYTDDYTLQSPTFVETFVLVVINDYAVSSQAGTPRRISQLKYATDTLTGQCTVKKRVGTGYDSISWGDWEEIGGGSSEVDITDAVNTYGLPTLISQGLAKEGVTYIAKLNANDIDTKLDTEGKIQLHIGQNGDGGGDTVDLVIKVRNHTTIGLVVEINAALTNEKFYKYVYYYNSGKVQVSADMTEL